MGWNCMNSGLRIVSPARRAAAIPSPVHTEGLEVADHSAPMPPVASTTQRAGIITVFPSDRAVTPHTAPLGPMMRSMRRVSVRTVIPVPSN